MVKQVVYHRPNRYWVYLCPGSLYRETEHAGDQGQRCFISLKAVEFPMVDGVFGPELSGSAELDNGSPGHGSSLTARSCLSCGKRGGRRERCGV